MDVSDPNRRLDEAEHELMLQLVLRYAIHDAIDGETYVTPEHGWRITFTKQ